MKHSILKTAIIFMAIVGLTPSLSAQKFYFELKPAYRLAATGSSSTDYEIVNDYRTGQSASSIKANTKGNMSNGKGLYLGGNFGYQLADHIAVDLGLGYQMGLVSGINSMYREYVYIYNDYTLTNREEQSIYGQMFHVVPGLRINTGGETFDLYTRFGLVAGVGKLYGESVDVDQTYDYGTDKVNTTKVEKKNDYYGGMAFGYQAALGMAYKIGRAAIFAEVDLTALSYSPTKSKYTFYTKNGIDQLPSMSVTEKETVYEKEYSISSSDVNNPDEPSKQAAFKSPMGSLGINIGFRFTL